MQRHNKTMAENPVFENLDLLAHILQYALSDVRDVPSIVRTCKHWDMVINKYGESSCRIWRYICTRSDPDLARIHDLCSESARHVVDAGGSWKALLRNRITSAFCPIGVNRMLQKNLETVFREDGIVAFSNCCSNCTDSYQDVPGFVLRGSGIKFFKLFLNGMFYDNHFLDGVFVVYTDLKYLLDHWDDECDIIRRWCAVLGLREGCYSIRKPRSDMECIFVEFGSALELEEEGVVFHKEVDEEPPVGWMDWVHSFDSFGYDLVESGGYC